MAAGADPVDAGAGADAGPPAPVPRPRRRAAAAAVAAAGPVRPVPTPDDVIAAVRLTGGLGAAMVMGGSIVASNQAQVGNCSELVGSMSVALLGSLLMFGGMLPMTAGDNTHIVWATGLIQFALIVMIAGIIIWLLALAKACPALAPQTTECDRGKKECEETNKARCKSVAKGMVRITAGLAMAVIVYLFMILPLPQTIRDTLAGLVGSVRNAGRGVHAAFAAPMGAGTTRRQAIRQRLNAVLRVLIAEGRGLALGTLMVIFFGLAFGLPWQGVRNIGLACRQTTAD